MQDQEVSATELPGELAVQDIKVQLPEAAAMEDQTVQSRSLQLAVQELMQQSTMTRLL
jgi:hypothetical protein